MYRTQEAGKSPNELEKDDNYEFSGATLKISGDDGQQNTQSNLAKDTINNESAILSVSDVASPIIHSANVLSGSGLNTNDPRQSAAPSKPKVGSPRHFFSFRSGQFERAVTDCINILLKPANDTEIRGSWLLTEVSHWDHERERVYILTTKTLLEIKYDFIALRILQHYKVRLIQVDTILKGKITYPQSSLVPRIEGITNGVTCIISASGDLLLKGKTQSQKPNNLALANRFDFKSFKPVERNDNGIRIMWNKGQPISFLTSWNPFTTEIPWKTIKDHPLHGYEDPYNSPTIQEGLEENHQIYSVENMYSQLVQVFADARDLHWDFKEGPIILENYVGIGAVIHNKHNFGFFKVRGKFSF